MPKAQRGVGGYLTVHLHPDENPLGKLDHILVNQDPKSGTVRVSGNVHDPANPKGVIVLTEQTFWSGDAAADEGRGMEAAEIWAVKYRVPTIYVRWRSSDAEEPKLRR